jgi:hypothetical protein
VLIDRKNVVNFSSKCLFMLDYRVNIMYSMSRLRETDNKGVEMVQGKMVICNACKAPLAFLKQWVAAFGVNSESVQYCKGCEKQEVKG